MTDDPKALDLLREAEDAIRQLRSEGDSPAISRLEAAIAGLKEMVSPSQSGSDAAVPTASDDTLG